jgi:iron complex outermembrane receptor protein
LRGRSGHWIWAAALCGLSAALGASARAETAADLEHMSIADLENIDVTSVSKRAEPLSAAAAAVYVITHDEIMRSGATSLPEILRLAPNLQVAVISANSYAIAARGFNGNAADKLLVLIDGRSVYTPLFGGVLWDQQDVPPEDIERIEVISGPGATLWGANAVNGVINIITRGAGDTPGGVLNLNGGNRGQRGDLQYGGKLAENLNYRVYVDATSTPSDKISTGADADDGWSKIQGGFRLDWTPASDKVMLQGDVYHGTEGQAGSPDLDIISGDLQVDWRHQFDGGSSLDVLAYYDATRRFSEGIAGYSLQTYDLEVQHSFSLGDRQQIVWGAGVRVYEDQFKNAGPVVYLPDSSAEALVDGFAQDSIALTRSLDLTLGLKLEKDPYADVSPLPTARLSWKLTDRALLWAAASRAVRAPTLFDEDLNDSIIPGVLVLTGSKQFRPEKLIAYETGARIQFTDAASISVSTYYNVYDDLRSTEFVRLTSLPLLLAWGNKLEGDTYGVEVWGTYQPADWWRLTAGFNVLREQLRFKPGAGPVNNLSEVGDDPGGQASVRSTMNLGHHLSWNADLRYVSALPNPRVPSYMEMDVGLAWAVTPRLQLSVSGANLLHPHHLEYEEAGAATGEEVQRSISFGTRLKF